MKTRVKLLKRRRERLGHRSLIHACEDAADTGRHAALLRSHAERVLVVQGMNHLAGRAGNQSVDGSEAPVEHRTGAAADSDIPGLDHLEREHRHVARVPQFE
jgi:hypothetical protein